MKIILQLKCQLLYDILLFKIEYEMEYNLFTYRAKILRVVDGDTIDALVDLGFSIQVKMRFRVIALSHDYFDTPETWRPKTDAERKHGEAATSRAKELLEGNEVILVSEKRGKYRYLCKILLSDDTDYGDKMVAEGFQKKDSYT